MSWQIVVLDPLWPERLQAMRALLPDGFELSAAASRSIEDQRRAIASADFVVAGDMPLTAELLAAAPGLKAAHKWGVGVDNFDLEAAAARQVRIFRTTGSNARPVAETALGLMLAVMRQIVSADRAMHAGGWPKPDVAPHCLMLSGRTVGLVGLGAIGTVLATLLQGFGCRLLYAKPRPVAPEEAARLGLEHVPLATLLAESDVVSLHCPLTPATRGLIDAAALARLRPHAILINTARGEVVDEAALCAALHANRLGGAGLDVFAVEPLPADHPLRMAPRLVLTPHVAASSADNFVPTIKRIFTNLANAANGLPVAPDDIVSLPPAGRGAPPL